MKILATIPPLCSLGTAVQVQHRGPVYPRTKAVKQAGGDECCSGNPDVMKIPLPQESQNFQAGAVMSESRKADLLSSS
jgi:hypothetical protein